MSTRIATFGYDPYRLLPAEMRVYTEDLALAREQSRDAVLGIARIADAWEIAPAPLRPIELHPNPSIARICRAIAGADASTGLPGADEGLPEGPHGEGAAPVTVVKWETPNDELDGMARYIQAAVRRTRGALEPARICVVAPNRQWAAFAERALVHRRFEVSMPRARLGLSAGSQGAGTARALAAYNRLCLLADPRDAAAWRVWLGAGSAGLAARAWADLLRHAGLAVPGQMPAEDGARALDVLAALADPAAFPGAAELIARRDEGLRFIRNKSGLKGYSLVDAVGADGLPEFEEALERLDADDHAPELLKKQLDAFTRPSFSTMRPAVRVATPQTLAASPDTFDLVWILACADGLMEGPRIEASIAAAASRADAELVISFFSNVPADVAQKLGMRAVRTRTVGGEQRAVVRPAPFLAAAGDAYPGTVGGQTLLAGL